MDFKNMFYGKNNKIYKTVIQSKYSYFKIITTYFTMREPHFKDIFQSWQRGHPSEC